MLTQNTKKRKVWELREQGHTFRQIGIVFGISPERARQMYLSYCLHLKWKDEVFTYPLPTQTGNAICTYLKHSNPTAEQILEVPPAVWAKVRNVGPKGMQCLLQLLVDKEITPTSKEWVDALSLFTR